MRLLNDDEVARLLANNPALRSRVITHGNLVASSGWDQTEAAQYTNLPIPVKGFVTSDSALGTVILFPDARGEIQYVLPDGAQQSGSLIRQIQAIPPDRPDMITEFVNQVIARIKELSHELPSVPDASSLVLLGAGIGLVWAITK